MNPERYAQIKKRFVDFADEHIAPRSADRDRTGSFDHKLWQRLSDSGFWRLGVPRDLGGDGGGIWDQVAAFEGLARGANDCGFVLSAAAHAGLMQLLLRHGTVEQQKRLLPGLMSGQVGATASTEASGGSHVAGIKTSAVRDPDGAFLLSGEKSHITNAPVADVVMIVGRVPAAGPKDITLFLVEKGQGGLTFGEHEDLLGLRTSPLGPIALDNVRVTEERLVGGVGEGLDKLYWCLTFDRLIYGIVVASHVERLLHLAADRSLRRQAFGAPLAAHQYIQDKLVRMKLTIEASRALAHVALKALDSGAPSASSLASCVKLLSAEGIVDASMELVQIFGHIGTEKSYGIERHLRDAVAFKIAGGTNEMQKKNIFKHVMREFQGELPEEV
ncbi:acyl-CoA dehydrogenase family protein [Streptomyces sp. NPDC004126]|uniref:acyl-CoA dehydrogenase family protein n=1 Tax=Streptomyces sp. NPDC004126 TaxID=3390695 RepID=UPI003D052FF9